MWSSTKPLLQAADADPARFDGVTRLGVDAVLENDATAAAIGENWLGGSRDVDTSICVTLGTGVGGGLMINGKPYRGKDGTAGEVGHICVEPDGHPCGCGSRGCVEQYASATAVIRMAREAGLDVSTSSDVYNWAKRGNEEAVDVFTAMGTYLGIGLAGLVNVLNPEMIVIGGGVSAAWELFAGDVRREVDERSFPEPSASGGWPGPPASPPARAGCSCRNSYGTRRQPVRAQQKKSRRSALAKRRCDPERTEPARHARPASRPAQPRRHPQVRSSRPGKPSCPVSYTHLTLPTSDLV